MQVILNYTDYMNYCFNFVAVILFNRYLFISINENNI